MIKLILGEDDKKVRRLLKRHIVVHTVNQPATYVEPNERQFPSLNLLRACNMMASAILTQEMPAHQAGKLVIVGVDDPQNPPRFGTMLANLIAFCIELQTGKEPGRAHARRYVRVVERKASGEKQSQSVWGYEFFDGTSLEEHRLFFVTDALWAQGGMRHVIKTSLSVPYQKLPYNKERKGDISRVQEYVAGIGCLVIRNSDEEAVNELRKFLGFEPDIFAFAPGNASLSKWGRKSMTSGEFRSLQTPDTRSQE